MIRKFKEKSGSGEIDLDPPGSSNILTKGRLLRASSGVMSAGIFLILTDQPEWGPSGDGADRT